ncbi:TlpA family protein disulfide reductase [Sphingobium sp.]|uniref:TlpA family protein disulfide reductase n=1 Tax=Sphingobium sp. TaxID=1912891 RepID=UPI0039C90592
MALLLLCGLTLMSGGCDRRSGENGQGGSNATTANAASAPTSGEVTPGEVKGGDKKGAFAATLDRSHKGAEAPDVVFSDPTGKDVSLADYKGKPVLVNLWATWCGPCVAEMPMLDKLAGTYKAKGLVVMTVSQDTGEPAQIAAFFAKNKLPHLAAWRDPENQLGFHYATGLLPTTVLYDREGKEVARVAGAMDWSGDEGRALIDDLMD